MPKMVNNDNDDTVVPETSYQGNPKSTSARATGKSSWALAIGAVFLVGIVVFVATGHGSHTDPAPYGASGSSTAPPQPAPTQNSQ